MKSTKKWILVGVFTLAWLTAVPFVQADPAPNPAFPIGIFYNPGPEDTTDARYAEIANMNANFIVGTNYVDTYAENDLALTYAQAHGLKMLVDDGRLKWNSYQELTQTVQNQNLQVSSTSPLGQTFKTPISTTMLGISTVQLHLGVPDLPAGVTVTLTVYNDPGKTYAFFSKSLTGPISGDTLTFDFYQAVGVGGGSYYMELTSSSPTALPIAASTTNAYADGQAYVNGIAQAADLTFNADISKLAYDDGQQPAVAALDEIAQHYANNDAVLGYNVFDEPFANMFARVKETVDQLKVHHPGNKSMVNLLPIESFNPFKDLNLSEPVNISGEFVTASKPLGQTFKTGSNQTKIANIILHHDYSTWRSEEVLTLKLWDSPQKNTLIAERSRSGAEDLWVSFEMDADVAADTSYYWELTHNGGGDNSVGWVVRSNGDLNWEPNGKAYVNGVPIESDFTFVLTSERLRTAEELYEDYVSEWVSLQPDVLVYDNYPFKTIHELLSGYYANLEVIRRQSLLGDIDFWSYILSVGAANDHLRAPTENEIRYHIYTNLAYGAKGIIYFTYWTPAANWGFHDGLILQDGTRNSSYTWAKNINSELLQLGPTLTSLTSQAVYHTGTLPESTTALPANFFLQPDDLAKPWIISDFTDSSGQRFVMIVNRDLTDASTGTFTMNPELGEIKEVSKQNGEQVEAGYDPLTGELTASFAPGEGRLYALNAPIPAANVTSLTTDASSVSAGSTFKVKYGLNSVTQDMYAQDIKLQYDPAVVELVSAKSIKQGISLLETVKDQAGSPQLILASEGQGNEITGQAEIVELTFNAKLVSQAATSEIKLTSATVADSNGEEYAAALSSVNVQVTPGMSGDFNQDNKVTVGDLSILAAHYGKDVNSPDWEQVKRVDLNRDGKIDIQDLVAFAKKILGNGNGM
ncbi:cohesin domain-containing protein [Paenibacillus eucommiae]|uniref:Dockerin domain-containing protein n=1 Tax=Paenibacillus eucommiae TaxID=1355755 RepID=A0ABS4J838_9BACL|nr:cohesin domain-containing protein [Paenibacillus eucommiae]MBP1996002.1 hypothetical protein [Paenibacillus eucommiae]